jgi:dipeptidyl aminopeptidase/acylaminoacyl peptidase
MNWKRLVLVLLGVAAAVVVILFFVLRPQVVSTNPGLVEGGVSRFAPFEITFSREMQTASVEELLAVSPEVSGEYIWENNTLCFTPNEGWPAGAEIEVSLEQGARSRLGLPLGEGVSWTFNVSPVMLAYLWPAGGGADIYLLDLDNGETRQLTETGGVFSYAVSPDGTGFYYFSSNSQGGSDLYQVDRFTRETNRVLTCQRAFCSGAAISPDGTWLAYQRNDSAVWLLPLEAGGGAQQVSTAIQSVSFPVWTDDRLLSYYDAAAQEFVVYQVGTGEIESWHNQSGELGTWSPGGNEFIAPEFFEVETDTLRGPSGESDFDIVDESELDPVVVASSHLQMYRLDSGRVTDLTEDNLAEDYSPTFSPDGTLLVFTRRYLDEERWTPGRQVWLMPAAPVSGISQRRQLTDAPDYEYSALNWHPDGERIAAVRFNVTLLIQPAEIWLLDLEGDATRLVIGGYAPQWVP